MKKASAVAGVVMLGVILSACSPSRATSFQVKAPEAPPEAPPPAIGPALGIAIENLPVVDSSTSAQPLTALLLYRVLGMGARWAGSLDGPRFLHTAPIPGESPEEARSRSQRIHRCMPMTGTHLAYVNLIRGLDGWKEPDGSERHGVARADLILVAREPSQDEIELARRERVELDVRPVARDAFVFIVNDQNPVSGLTLDQVRAIYTGAVKNWKDVGGSDAAIRAYTRDRNSGSQELMEKLVMKGAKMIEGPDIMNLTSMMGPFNRINADKNGIGYTVFYYEAAMAPPRSATQRSSVRPGGERRRKVLAVNGVAPAPRTIADGTYPLVTDVYAVVRKDTPADHPAVRLRDWLLTPEGQAVVAESGYVPIAR